MKEQRIQFKVHRFAYSEEGIFRQRSAIVLKDTYLGLVIKFTDFADRMYTCDRDFEFANACNDNELYYVCQFLNYCLVHYDLTDIRDVTAEMAKSWLDDYSATPTKSGEFPAKDTVRGHRDAVCKFLFSLCVHYGKEMKELKKSDVIVNANSKLVAGGRIPRKPGGYTYMIPYRYFSESNGYRQIYRDMPQGIVEKFLRVAETYDPELVFAIALQAYMGLREGEVCNVHRTNRHGAGLIITYTATGLIDEETGEFGKVADSIEVILNKELVLRSDMRNVGKIKKERNRPCYAGFTDKVFKYYKRHLELIKDLPCEEEFMPMFVNRNMDRTTGCYRAMTVSAYRQRLQKLYQKVLESCKYSTNLAFQRFYADITYSNRTWGAHAFRHWFTVELVLAGLSAPQVKQFRGDASIESAESYLNDKGRYMELYHQASDANAALITGRRSE